MAIGVFVLQYCFVEQHLKNVLVPINILMISPIYVSKLQQISNILH